MWEMPSGKLMNLMEELITEEADQLMEVIMEMDTLLIIIIKIITIDPMTLNSMDIILLMVLSTLHNIITKQVSGVINHINMEWQTFQEDHIQTSLLKSNNPQPLNLLLASHLIHPPMDLASSALPPSVLPLSTSTITIPTITNMDTAPTEAPMVPDSTMEGLVKGRMQDSPLQSREHPLIVHPLES